MKLIGNLADIVAVGLNRDELRMLIGGPRETKQALANLSSDEFTRRTGYTRQEMDEFLEAAIRIYDEKPPSPEDEKQLQQIEHEREDFVVQIPKDKVHLIMISFVETLEEVDDWEFELLLGVTRPEMETFLAEWLAIAQH